MKRYKAIYGVTFVEEQMNKLASEGYKYVGTVNDSVTISVIIMEKENDNGLMKRIFKRIKKLF